SLILLNLLIESVSHPLMVGAQAHGNIKWYQIVFGTFHFLNLPLSYILFTLGWAADSFLYVAIGITLATSALRLVFLKRMIGLQITAFLSEVLLPVIMVSLCVCVGLWLLYETVGS